MAKEMMIVFVYDTLQLKNEEDDPATAILYFHPGWVSDQQKTALCGQIMGTTHFLKSVFACAKIISLQSGKFSMRDYGRYVLAVGTDRNIADWVLEYRADTLASLIKFFHNDLDFMAEVYQNNENLSAKLYHTFETYLKILTYSNNLFSNVPKIQLPKSASNVFLEAVQILQCCQEVSLVLGGTLLYHNKVVATQLSSNLTKQLVLTDPYRIKSPAECVDVNFQLPLGVQLLQVYIDGNEYQDLLEDATRSREVYQYLNRKPSTKKMLPTKEPVLTAMKRDQSLIFTTVPEEDSDAHSPVNIETMASVKPLIRPKFLNLRNKTTDDKPPASKAAPVTTPFHGQTSICSTPMTDLNKVLHPNIMRICADGEENNCDKERKQGSKSIAEEKQSGSKSSDTDEWKSVEDLDSVNSRKRDDIDNLIVGKLPDLMPKEARKSLTLPLKSLSTESSENVFSPRNYGGVQLTPLMSKLSLLAMEERSSGFCSRETTPSEYKDARFMPAPSVPRQMELTESKFRRRINDKLKRGILFICGQQDMVVALLLEESACTTSDIIRKLWEMCIESLGRLEKQLRQCLEVHPGGNTESGEPYSYLSMDQYWDTVQRGGPWGATELGALTHLHRDFHNGKQLTEILLRDDDSIIYGHHSGKTEVYYMQATNGNAGLPPPADPMGMVSLKAKRRLERDHAIILL